MPAKQETTSFPELQPDHRLAELLLYVAKKSRFDPHFGNTKLNKILFYSDFVSFGRRGRPVTGAEYIKQEFGPTPRRLVPVRKELEAKGAAVLQRTEAMGGYEQQRLLHLREPDLSLFSADDIALVDEVIEYLRNKTAKEVSELSHNRVWRVAQMGESIPYEAVFVSDDNPTDADAERAQALIRDRGWAV